MKKNILIFPCGSEIGLELHRALSLDIHFKLFGGSSVNDHGKFIFENYIDGMPMIEDANFVDKVNEIIDSHKIDLIFPAHDSVVLKLAQNRDKLHCGLITSDVGVCEIARSKSRTYKELAGVIPVPDMNPANYPIFLKPDVGQGSKGCLLAKSLSEVENAIQKDPTLLKLEYLPGPEYTIDCFTDDKGKLLFAQGRTRQRISNGISVNSIPVNNQKFHEYAEKINAKIPFRGVWFFQLKERANGEMALLEIAPRVAGTMALARMQGVNLPLMAAYSAIGASVDVVQNKYDIEIDRALENRFRMNIDFDSAYVDFDDCLVIDRRVNTSLVSFLFAVLNENKKLILLTKHDGDINDALAKYRLQNLFDKVIHIEKIDQKYKYILDKKAIFIDDSFTERKAIAENLGIPVFSPDMIGELAKGFTK